MKGLKSIRHDNAAATRKSRRDERVWAAGIGWLSATQQANLRDAYHSGEGGRVWLEPTSRSYHQTLSSLERRGLLEVRLGGWVRMTDRGLALVRGWLDAEDDLEDELARAEVAS